MGLTIVLLLIFIADIYCIVTMRMEKKKETLKKYSKIDLYNMTGREFEMFCTKVFAKNGYKSCITQATRDGGKDIVLYKNKELTYVECKRYTKEPIGRDLVQKLIGSAYADNVWNVVFVTTSRFTQEACDFMCKINKDTDMKCDLMDADDILKLANGCEWKGIENTLILKEGTN